MNLFRLPQSRCRSVFPLILTLFVNFGWHGDAANAQTALPREDYRLWKHSGSLTILTTPEGAELPATAVVENFPLLVRLNSESLDFRQASPTGDDLRVSSETGTPLPFQIEAWDAVKGEAAVWIRIPQIRGNARQTIRLYWGNPAAKTASHGDQVFNEENGYLCVFHMNGPVQDETGRLECKDTGTTEVLGMIGEARHFPGQRGVFCGDKIAGFPTQSTPNTTEAWFRSEVANGRVLGWGNEEAQGKVILNYRSPPHVRMECYFSGADVAGKTPVPRFEWVHVVHTYRNGESLLYVNGILDGVTRTNSSPLAIKTPARMWIGGWYDNYDFSGDVDEVRVSNVVRSPEWARLSYENQKPLQTLAGHLIQKGEIFSVTPEQVSVVEGESVDVTAQAGGAQKVYWTLKRDGEETLISTDRFQVTVDAGRVSGDQLATLRFKAIYPDKIETRDIPVMIREAIADPEFRLEAPTDWDGRTPLEIVAQVTNPDQLKSAAARQIEYEWSVADLAVTRETAPGKLRLLRAQNSGTLTVVATARNGGSPIQQQVQIAVTEPASDPWVVRTPADDEKPVEHQFYARDDKNEGTLFYCGKLDEHSDGVFLKLYANDKLVTTETSKLDSNQNYHLTAKLKPGLIQYRVEFGKQVGGAETVLNRVGDLVCGDAYVINGQSNAVATDWGEGGEQTFRSEWIRSFGSMSGNPQGARIWGQAVHRSRDEEKLQLGYWGMELARQLVENHKMPICIINGAVGGTRVDQHQRDPENPLAMSTIYGRLLWRVTEARLTHGIRGIFWHQGENDQGADGPTGGFGYETYRPLFLDLAAAWKQDYPNLQHYYVFQIWPKSCSMGFNGSDNRLREVQRNLPTAFSRMSIMSTVGIKPPGGCHYPQAGYLEFAKLIAPLVERDNYGKVFTSSITPPNLVKWQFANPARDEILIEFDQPVQWDDQLFNQFSLDDKSVPFISGESLSETKISKQVKLKLKGPSKGQKLTYLDSAAWNPNQLLYGANRIAVLTFCDVPLETQTP